MTQGKRQFYERNRSENSLGSREVDYRQTKISGPCLDLQVLYVAPEKVIIHE